jgi:hypothetical protein
MGVVRDWRYYLSTQIMHLAGLRALKTAFLGHKTHLASVFIALAAMKKIAK